MEYEVEELFKTQSVFQLKSLVVNLETELLDYKEKLQDFVKIYKLPIIQSGSNLKQINHLLNELPPISNSITFEPENTTPEPILKLPDDDLMNSTKVRLLLDLSEQLFILLESNQPYNATLTLKYAHSLYDPQLNDQFPFIRGQWDTIVNFNTTINQMTIHQLNQIQSIDEFQKVYELVVGWCMNLGFSGSLGLAGWLELKSAHLLSIIDQFNNTLEDDIEEAELWTRTSTLVNDLISTLVSSIYYTIHLFVKHSHIFWTEEFNTNLHENYKNLIKLITPTNFTPIEEDGVPISKILPPNALHHLIKRLPNKYHQIPLKLTQDPMDALTIDWLEDMIINWIEETLSRISSDALLSSLGKLANYPKLISSSFNEFYPLIEQHIDTILPNAFNGPSDHPTKLERTIINLKETLWHKMVLPPIFKTSQTTIHQIIIDHFQNFDIELRNQFESISQAPSPTKIKEQELIFGYKFNEMEFEWKSIEFTKQFVHSNLPISLNDGLAHWLAQLQSQFNQSNQTIQLMIDNITDESIRNELNPVIRNQRMKLSNQLIKQLEITLDNSNLKNLSNSGCELCKVIKIIDNELKGWSQLDINKNEWNQLIHKLQQMYRTSYRRWVHSTSDWFMESIQYLFQTNLHSIEMNLSEPTTNCSSKLYQILTQLNYDIWLNWGIEWNEDIRSNLFKEIYFRLKLELKQLDENQLNCQIWDFRILSWLIFQLNDHSLPDLVRFNPNDQLKEPHRQVIQIIYRIQSSIYYLIDPNRLNDISKPSIESNSESDWIPIAIPAPKLSLLE